jgi:hypothetical protein
LICIDLYRFVWTVVDFIDCEFDFGSYRNNWTLDLGPLSSISYITVESIEFSNNLLSCNALLEMRLNYNELQYNIAFQCKGCFYCLIEINQLTFLAEKVDTGI